jgi:ABC-2 type transport system ATP-binding protein
VSVLAAAGLGRRYGRIWALRDCRLAVPAGHVAALVGPNGAGKTTLLHLAVGLARPTAGQVRVLDGLVPGSSAALAGTGFVAQDAPLYQHLTVAATLDLARSLNQRWDAAQATARLGRLGIPLGHRVGALSGGQQAQLALAIALAKRPRLLLLDEPLARLDPLARHEFLGLLMAAVAETGLSVIFSSHVLAELERIADYLIVLNAGRLQVAGRVDDLLATHRVLTGPADELAARSDGPGWGGPGWGGPGAGFSPVQVTRAGAQLHAVVRGSGPDDPVPDRCQAHPIGLEELVLAYLREPGASVLPGPETAVAGGRP